MTVTMNTQSAPLGWVLSLYRTFPVKTAHGIGIDRELISQRWVRTAGRASDIAHHRAWEMNGEYTPGSSFGTTGAVGDPDPTWRYSFSTHGQRQFHGYAFEWSTVKDTGTEHGPQPRPTCQCDEPRSDCPTADFRPACVADLDITITDPGVGHPKPWDVPCIGLPFLALVQGSAISDAIGLTLLLLGVVISVLAMYVATRHVRPEMSSRASSSVTPGDTDDSLYTAHEYPCPVAVWEVGDSSARIVWSASDGAVIR